MSCAAAFALESKGGEKEPLTGRVRFCLFADLHYMPGVFPNDTTDFLDGILKRAKAERVDFVLHLGDLIHRSRDKAERAFVERYNNCGIPAYHTIGNHENDGGTERDTLEAFGIKCGHYHFDVNGFRFIICDCNYIRRANGKVEHYQNGNYFSRGKDDVIAWMPEEQIAWLANAIEGAPGPCVVCSHQSFEREKGGVVNFRAVREVLESANRKHPGRVMLVMNGHYHTDNLRILNGIPYYDVNSANYQWFDGVHGSYPVDYVKAHSLANHTIAWNRPICAIVTLKRDGLIRIEGSQADWMFGVTPKKAGLPPWDSLGRLVQPKMQSANLILRADGE